MGSGELQPWNNPPESPQKIDLEEELNIPLKKEKDIIN